MKYRFSQYFLILISWFVFCFVYLGNHFILHGEEYIQEKERDNYKTFSSDDDVDSSFPSNPMQIMDMIRENSSLEDATSPSDALDQALKLFNYQDEDNLTDEIDK